MTTETPKPAAAAAASKPETAKPVQTEFDLSNMTADQLKKIAADAEARQAELKREHIASTRAAVEKIAADAGLTMKDIGFQPIKSKSKDPIGPAKYRNPADPKQTWTGSGRKPKWILDAIAKGDDIEKMRI